MIIRRYSIELHRVTRADLELIRIHRNREDIRSRMFDQHIISPDEQERWFESIDNPFNYYFVIHYEGRKVGLIHGKNVDYDKREDEGGIFIWEDSLLGTGVPARASICFIECSFHLLLSERIFARVRQENSRARQYNLALGYAPCTEKGEDYMVLTRAAYEARALLLRRIASGRKSTTPFSPSDVEISVTDAHPHLYQSLPSDILEIIKARLPDTNHYIRNPLSKQTQADFAS